MKVTVAPVNIILFYFLSLPPPLCRSLRSLPKRWCRWCSLQELSKKVRENVEGILFPDSPETGRSPARSTTHLTRRHDIKLSEEILHANGIIQSLNSSSTVAHISGTGLKVIPTISSFPCLRSVNLSNNYIGNAPSRKGNSFRGYRYPKT
jgi:hypothetical protein